VPEVDKEQRCEDPKPVARLPLFTDCREVAGDVACPGDSGYSTIPVFGRTMRLRKDSPAIMLMGCLDELVNLTNGIRLNFKNELKVASMAAVVMALSMQLNAYLVQGTQERLSKVKIVETLLETKVSDLCSSYRGDVGWIVASTPEAQAIDGIRVKLRECGRVASSMLDKYPEVDNIIKVLNHADKLVAQSLYCLGGKVYKSIDDVTGALLSSTLDNNA